MENKEFNNLLNKLKESKLSPSQIKELQKLRAFIPKVKSKEAGPSIIEMKNIEKTFSKRGKNKLEVHKGISLEVYAGETLALIGANGAGKTVLMETLVGVRSQDSGEIIMDFDGIDPFEEIGMQFQDSELSIPLTVMDLINFITKMYEDKVDKKQLAEMIKIYGIEPYKKKKIKKLSGGQRQRVNLLLATMHNPKLMILDEFITGLDIVSVRDILAYIKKLKEMNDATVIIITHQPAEIKELSDRIIVLKDGKVVENHMTSEINAKYNGDFSEFLLEKI